MTAKALVFMLVSMCYDTAQALVSLLVSVCCDTAQALVSLLVSVCCDTAQALVFSQASLVLLILILHQESPQGLSAVAFVLKVRTE